jgi:D-alanyl-D-alanine carboxypeptidase/D-alanyl-D-alanine-endopeptidase (penicillin-binding protein 4)
MTRSHWALRYAFGYGLLASPVSALDRPRPADLQSTLETWFARASRSAPGTWGIAVATQEGRLLWAIDPTRPMVPASTVKLFTTGFARSVLGGEARRSTRFLGTGHVDPFSGTWVGDWSLELNGDPTLERPMHGGPTLFELALQLKQQGVRRLTGALQLVSATGEADAVFPAAWDPRHQGRYFAPLVGNVVVNEGLVTIAVGPGAAAGRLAVLRADAPSGVSSLVDIKARTVAGPSARLSVQKAPGGRFVVTGTIGTRSRTRWFTMTAHDPRAVVGAIWSRALVEADIEWDRKSEREQPAFPLARPVILAQVSSSPFDSIAMEVNRRSINIGAELLLRWAGGGQDPAALLTEHVRQVTGDISGLRLVDGSGLSHQDRVSPLTFISYLARFPLLPAGRGFPLLLPTNGSGTLRHLAIGMPGPGIVRAKTGTLGDVASVVGYLGRTDGVLLISLMYNGPRVYSARQEQWKLFRQLGAQGVLIPEDSLGISSQFGGSGGKDTIPE